MNNAWLIANNLMWYILMLIQQDRVDFSECRVVYHRLFCPTVGYYNTNILLLMHFFSTHFNLFDSRYVISTFLKLTTRTVSWKYFVLQEHNILLSNTTVTPLATSYFRLISDIVPLLLILKRYKTPISWYQNVVIFTMKYFIHPLVSTLLIMAPTQP